MSCNSTIPEGMIIDTTASKDISSIRTDVSTIMTNNLLDISVNINKLGNKISDLEKLTEDNQKMLKTIIEGMGILDGKISILPQYKKALKQELRKKKQEEKRKKKEKSVPPSVDNIE